MKSTREQFEEIWPVPKRIYWSEQRGEYLPQDCNMPHLTDQCIEWDVRLDTFTRCQETTAIHLSLIDELMQSLQWYVDEDEIIEGDEGNAYWVAGKHAAEDLIDRAKQIMEQNK